MTPVKRESALSADGMQHLLHSQQALFKKVTEHVDKMSADLTVQINQLNERLTHLEITRNTLSNNL